MSEQKEAGSFSLLIMRKAVAEVFELPRSPLILWPLKMKSFSYHAEDIQLICLPNSAAAYFCVDGRENQENWKEETDCHYGRRY